MKNTKRNVLLSLGGLLVVAQLIPFPPAENPPVGDEIQAPAQVMALLRASCYDCHSNETVWPWYSHVIPSKWYVRQHVVEGRSHLNFSTWGDYSPRRAQHRLEEVMEYVSEGWMPLESYLRLHPEAELGQAERQVIVEWAQGMLEAYQAPPPADSGTLP